MQDELGGRPNTSTAGDPLATLASKSPGPGNPACKIPDVVPFDDSRVREFDSMADGKPVDDWDDSAPRPNADVCPFSAR